MDLHLICDASNWCSKQYEPKTLMYVSGLQLASHPHCNIPLVGIGILPVKCVRGQTFMEIKYDGECFIK